MKRVTYLLMKILVITNQLKIQVDWPRRNKPERMEMTYLESIKNKVKEEESNIIETLKELISKKSVGADKVGDMPFGEGVDDAFKYAAAHRPAGRRHRAVLRRLLPWRQWLGAARRGRSR